MYIHSICILSCRFSHFGKIKWDEPGKLWGLGRLFITGAKLFYEQNKKQQQTEIIMKE